VSEGPAATEIEFVSCSVVLTGDHLILTHAGT